MLCLAFGALVFSPFSAAAQQPVSEEAETFDNFLLRGSEQYEKGLYAESAATMKDFLIRFVDDPLTPRALKRVFYLLTLSSVRLNNWEEVASWADKYQKDPGVGAETWDSEVAFWKALSEDRLGRFESAHHALVAFANTHPTHNKTPVALQLAGSALIKANKWPEAAEYYAAYRKQLTGYPAGEAFLLEMHSRLEAGQNDKVLEMIDQARTIQTPRPAALQLMIVRLADRFHAGGDQRRTLATLFRLAPKSEVLKQQEAGIAALEQQVNRLRRSDPDGLSLRLAESLLKSAKSSAKAFARIPNFDSTARYRIAAAFLSMKRYREAAQVLAGMLASMPPDPVVERASEAVVKSYAETKQWEKAVAAAESFSRKFPASDLLPGVLILQGQSLQELERYDEADKVFDECMARFPRHELAPHARFAKAFSSVWREDYPAAAAGFQEVIDKYPGTPAAESALFWKAQTASLSKQWPETIQGMQNYLAKYPDGASAAEAEFRIAFAEHAQRHYDTSIPLASAFIEKFPDDPNRPEASLILADGLLARGEIDAGLAALRDTPKGSSFREEAWFRMMKVYRLQEDLPKMREIIAAYREEYPTSPRLAESVYWEGWTYRDEPERQRQVYLDAVRKYGADPGQWGVAEMLGELTKASRSGEASDQLAEFLKDLAAENSPRSLRLWGTWGLAQLEGKEGRTRLVAARTLINPSEDSPMVMLDVADALRAAGLADEAMELYKDIRRWNPMNALNDRVFASLGLLALERGQPEEAMRFFDRFLRETPASAKRGEVLVRSGDALAASGRSDEALARYEEALAEKGTPRRLKAEALLKIGELRLAAGDPRKAAPYFQRVFVLYSAYPELAARAYLGSARSMAGIGEPLEEARVLLEFIDRAELTGEAVEAARAEASRRLEALPPATVSAAREKNAATQLADSEAADISEGKSP
ncbi:MAG: hypothetical protein Fur0032_04750 [Terrimicrobiaceae bacterium]